MPRCSTQFPLELENCVCAALVLSLLTHSRASPLVTQTGSKSWGSDPLGECQEKKSRSFWRDFQPVSLGLLGADTSLLSSSGCTQAMQTRNLSRMVVWKGKLWLLQDWEGTEATPLGFLIKPPRLVGTTFFTKIAGLVYMCFLLSYSNLFTRDRNPGKSILKARWHLSTWQIIKAPWKSQESMCKQLTKLYDVNAKRRRSAG